MSGGDRTNVVARQFWHWPALPPTLKSTISTTYSRSQASSKRTPPPQTQTSYDTTMICIVFNILRLKVKLFCNLEPKDDFNSKLSTNYMPPPCIACIAACII